MIIYATFIPTNQLMFWVRKYTKQNHTYYIQYIFYSPTQSFLNIVAHGEVVQ